MGKIRKTCVVAGGAGFLGSHLCDALLSDGSEVVCVDNFRTGRIDNMRQLRREPRLLIVEADVINPLSSLLPRNVRRVD